MHQKTCLFDLASRRLTPFSLKDGKSKGEVRRYIKCVIQDTVENILENGKRVKAGFSDLRLGCFVDGAVSNLMDNTSLNSSCWINCFYCFLKPVNPSTQNSETLDTPLLFSSLRTPVQYLLDSLAPTQIPSTSFIPSSLMAKTTYDAFVTI